MNKKTYLVAWYRVTARLQEEEEGEEEEGYISCNIGVESSDSKASKRIRKTRGCILWHGIE